MKNKIPAAIERELKYIADSPDRKYGGFHPRVVTTAKNALREIRRLRKAVKWALGEGGDFPTRPEGKGPYYWRTELRRRAGMKPTGIKIIEARPIAPNTASATCKRCGKPFQSKPTKLRITKMTTCCETCRCKNLFDGLGMPTPPSLLDKHTKHPTLTDAEWRKKIKADEAV